MSVVARAPDGTIRLFCKGADNIMIPRLRQGIDPNLLSATQDNLKFYSVQVCFICSMHSCLYDTATSLAQDILRRLDWDELLIGSGLGRFCAIDEPKSFIHLLDR